MFVCLFVCFSFPLVLSTATPSPTTGTGKGKFYHRIYCYYELNKQTNERMKELEKRKKGQRKNERKTKRKDSGEVHWLALRLADGNQPTSPFRQFADCLWIFNLEISTECEEFISVLNTDGYKSYTEILFVCVSTLDLYLNLNCRKLSGKWIVCFVAWCLAKP